MGSDETRWTPEIERVLAEAMLAELYRQDANDDELSVGWFVARAGLAALTAAGWGDVSAAERRDEWAVARGEPPWHAACADGCGCADWWTATGVLVAARDQQEARGWIAASTAPGLKLMRRTVHTGPWAEVTDGTA